jgi:hypothetical protein
MAIYRVSVICVGRCSWVHLVRRQRMEEKPVPFFAQFLEEQEFPRVKTDVKAGPKPPPPKGPPIVTMKWPSDDDDNPPSI